MFPTNNLCLYEQSLINAVCSELVHALTNVDQWDLIVNCCQNILIKIIWILKIIQKYLVN